MGVGLTCPECVFLRAMTGGGGGGGGGAQLVYKDL